MFYCARNLYATIRATMLAKISSAGRDFRIIGTVEWRAADRPGFLWNRLTLPSVVGVRAFGSGAAPRPPISHLAVISAVELANGQRRGLGFAHHLESGS